LDPIIIGVFGVVIFLLLLLMGVHVGVSMLAAGLLGSTIILGFRGVFTLFETGPFTIASTYAYAALPLFLLMGSFASYGGFASGAFHALYRWVYRLPGALAIATTLACGAFGAASGVSVATAAIFTKICLPEMKKYRYDLKLSAGCIAASGTFATMIPPSVLLIIYGIFTDTSIAKLFLAGILPGLLTVFAYSVLIIYRVKRHPQLAPVARDVRFSWKDKFSALPDMWPIAVLAALVIGGIYAGWFSPTEAGAAGATGAFLIAVIQKGYKGANLPAALRETAETSALIMIITVGAIIFSRFLAVSQIPIELALFLRNLPVPPVVILICFLIVYFFLGMVVSAIAMLAITLPIIAPLLVSMGYDIIWFGIIAIKMCEIAQVTPPVGMNVYVVKGVAGEELSLEQAFAAVWPFIFCDIAVLALLILFPQIVLFLPNLAR
jgi:tripartite ATP-independent transporter DctM subunit